MYWQGETVTDNGLVLAVGVRIIGGKYHEFAGRGRSVQEAKAKALLVAWRQSRVSHGLPDEHVGKSYRITRMGKLS